MVTYMKLSISRFVNINMALIVLFNGMRQCFSSEIGHRFHQFGLCTFMHENNLFCRFVFSPQYYYFNHGSNFESLGLLRFVCKQCHHHITLLATQSTTLYTHTFFITLLTKLKFTLKNSHHRTECTQTA